MHVYLFAAKKHLFSRRGANNLIDTHASNENMSQHIFDRNTLFTMDMKWYNYINYGFSRSFCDLKRWEAACIVGAPLVFYTYNALPKSKCHMSSKCSILLYFTCIVTSRLLINYKQMQHLALFNTVFKCYNTELFTIYLFCIKINCPSTSCYRLSKFSRWPKLRVKRSQQVEWCWTNILILFDHAFSRVCSSRKEQ